MEALMSDQTPDDQGDHQGNQGNQENQRNQAKAKKLFKSAQDHASKGDFEGALKLFERSLRLCEDSVVREAFLEFMATIGPM